MELRVILEKLSSIGPEIDFLKSNKVLEKITNAFYQTSEHAHAPYFFCHHDHGGKGAAAAALDWSIGPMFGVVFVVTGFPRPATLLAIILQLEQKLFSWDRCRLKVYPRRFY